MYSTLYTNIDAILAKVTQIQQRFSYPIGQAKIEKYPALIYFPVRQSNEFSTTSENAKVYDFVIYVVVGTANKSKEDIFKTTLANAVDAVIAQFDEDWGSTIDGHRCWLLINSGNWTVDSQGNEAIAELNLQIKVMTDN